ncbi:probable E3 ubiquitin ligase SUD1 [Papaver somniferum]|uniref:probable E3 ubiquitin ligase SUD1 n=1 Tax=Papaver somniferum TaxID=3469 RepID=UPI000E6F7FF2|nr:probable E3 ubiquitin ligase SUD1 [Papaver somniferum]
MEPIRAIVVEAPVLLLCQNWAVGFFFFKLWRTLVLLNHRIVLVDESWRIKFERVRDNGILKLPGCWMLQEILIPIVMNLLVSLCLLYVLARGIVPLLGFWITVNSTWVAYVTIIVLFSCAKRFSFWITELHNSILTDRYSGFGLQNFGEVAIQCENEIDELVRRLSDSRGCQRVGQLRFNVIKEVW